MIPVHSLLDYLILYLEDFQNKSFEFNKNVFKIKAGGVYPENLTILAFSLEIKKNSKKQRFHSFP